MIRWQTILPADEYDTLELAALTFGGVGESDWFAITPLRTRKWKEVMEDANCPVCINGLGIFAGIAVSEERERLYTQADYTCHVVPTSIPTAVNDHIVRSLIAVGKSTRDARGYDRVTFADFCAFGNIVRGDR